MRKGLTFLLAGLLTAACVSMTAVRTVAADDSMASMDCSQAESMLEKAVATRIPSMMTGDVDKDFSTIMMVHEKVGMRINQIEAKCGKDPKMQSMAARHAADAQQRMDEFLHQGTSQ